MPSMLFATRLIDAAGKPILQREYFYADIPSVPAVSGHLLLRADPKYTDPDCNKFSPGSVAATFHDVAPLLAQAIGAEFQE